MSKPDDPTEQRDVLSSLPRSRRQRPSARREAARAGRSAAATTSPAKSKATARKSTAAKPRAAGPKASPKPRPAASAKPRPRRNTPAKRSAIPPAGYATPREGSGHGSADPGGAIADLVRGILRKLPF